MFIVILTPLYSRIFFESSSDILKGDGLISLCGDGNIAVYILSV